MLRLTPLFLLRRLEHMEETTITPARIQPFAHAGGRIISRMTGAMKSGKTPILIIFTSIPGEKLKFELSSNSFWTRRFAQTATQAKYPAGKDMERRTAFFAQSQTHRRSTGGLRVVVDDSDEVTT